MKSVGNTPPNNSETFKSDESSWSKMAEEAPPFNNGSLAKEKFDQFSRQNESEDFSVSGIPITYEEANQECLDRLKHELALFDKYDYEKQTEESLDSLLGGESTPNPTTDTESLIENIIWVNQRKLSRTDLSESERKQIEQKITEAESAKKLFESEDDRRDKLEKEITYYSLPIQEQTNDRWLKIQGFLTEEEKNAACFENPTAESVSEFTKTIIDKIDRSTIDKIIEAKKSGDKQSLVETITYGLAFMTQFDNQRPIVRYVEYGQNDIVGGCHEHLSNAVTDVITINKELLTKKYSIDDLITLVGHEMFHAYQNTYMRNADATDERAQSYQHNLEHYIQISADPDEFRQYHDQLVEIEAFVFGEQFRDLVGQRERYLRELNKPKGLLNRLKKILGR